MSNAGGDDDTGIYANINVGGGLASGGNDDNTGDGDDDDDDDEFGGFG
jgi:hypothetical protein